MLSQYQTSMDFDINFYFDKPKYELHPNHHLQFPQLPKDITQRTAKI